MALGTSVHINIWQLPVSTITRHAIMLMQANTTNCSKSQYKTLHTSVAPKHHFGNGPSRNFGPPSAAMATITLNMSGTTNYNTKDMARAGHPTSSDTIPDNVPTPVSMADPPPMIPPCGHA